MTRNATERLRIARVEHSAAGMSLLECLGYIAVFAVVVNICMSLLVNNSRLSVFCTASVERQRMADQVRLDLSQTVHEALRVVPSIGAYRTSGEQLVLELPAPADALDARRYVVLAPTNAPSGPVRLTLLEKDGQFEAEACNAYPSDLRALRFSYGDGAPEQARSVAMELNIKDPRAKEHAAPTTYHLVVVLRGTPPLLAKEGR